MNDIARCHLCDDDSKHTCGGPTPCHPEPVTGGRSSQYIIVALKSSGMPIAAIAEILGVTRASVYSWLDGTTEPPDVCHQHLVAVHDALTGEPIGALKFHHWLWQRTLPDGGTGRLA